MKRALLIAVSLAAAAPAAAQQAQQATPYSRAIAAGYKAAMLCSGIFIAGRTQRQVEALELTGIYAVYQPLVTALPATVERAASRVTVAWSDSLPPRIAEWRPGTGCTNLPIGTEPATGATRRAPPSPAGADPRPWPMGDRGVSPRPSQRLSGAVAQAFDGARYGAGSRTVGVVVVRGGRIAAERYADGFGPFTANRTWSVAKSLAGAIFGAAQQQRHADVAAPAAVPEWRRPSDPRGAITSDQLLRMASGLHSATAGNRTDALYFGGTAVDEETVGWPLETAPGTRFRYANNDILLAMRGLAASLPAAEAYPDRLLFDRIGMRHTVAETDWRGNYILSSQVWSTARDLARFGLLMAQDGVWAGERILPAGWMAESIRPSGPQPADGPGYGRTLWLFGPAQGLPAGSYAGQGNRGQYVMVVPSRDLVLVRRGEDPAGASFDIAGFTRDVLAAIG